MHLTYYNSKDLQHRKIPIWGYFEALSEVQFLHMPLNAQKNIDIINLRFCYPLPTDLSIWKIRLYSEYIEGKRNKNKSYLL